jgi:beta-lactam-binding protein with PASTA domain
MGWGTSKERTATVPNVVGKTAEEANRILLNSGFNIKIEGTTNFIYGQEAIVVFQDYQEFLTLPMGTIITIKILYVDDKD